jgi:hypothetical protein
MRREYPAVAYRQATNPTAPWIISFVAEADELLNWVGIPRRTEKGLVGFQRLDEEARVLRAKEYFQEPNNQSPTALILGIHESPLDAPKMVELVFDEPEESGKKIRKCKLIVNFDPDVLSDDDIKNIIKTQINYRLSQEEKLSVPSSQDDEVADSEEEDYVEDDEDGSSTEHGGEIELGRSLLSDLLNMLEDKVWFDANREALLDYAKPATLIDGQHRLKGADATERSIPFTICALYNCAWSEQVFQFTIVNYTQNGIPDQFITANAALSLTRNELDSLNTRLKQAQVKVIEYDLMKIVNFDNRSPFFELINIGSNKDDHKIGYKTMIKIAKQWYSGKNLGVIPIIENLYPDLSGSKAQKKRAALEKWKNEHWGDFFIAFWSEVKSFYENHQSHEKGHSLWQVGYSNLMIAAVLSAFQDTFLKSLSEQDEDFFKTPEGVDPVQELLRKCRERTKKVLQFFPPEFFAKVWKQKSLNTGAGKTVLLNVLQEMKDSKGRFGYANSSLITGRSS